MKAYQLENTPAKTQFILILEKEIFIIHRLILIYIHLLKVNIIQTIFIDIYLASLLNNYLTNCGLLFLQLMKD